MNRQYNICWDITICTEISQDLLRSYMIYWFGKIHLKFDIWTFTFGIWHLTFDIWHWHAMTWHLTSTEISQDLLRSYKICWYFTWSTEISKDLLIWHYTFDIWHLVFDIWHLTCHDIPWHLTLIWHLTFDIWHLTFDITECTDRTNTDIGTILSHFHWWILRLSAIQKKSLTDWTISRYKRC